MRHARQELRLEPIRFFHLVRLPQELRVLLLEVGGGGANAVLEVEVEPLELLVQSLVLHLLPQVVQRRDDGDRLATLVEDLASHHLDGQPRHGAWIDERHARLRGALRREQEIRDEGREMRVVAAHRLLLAARRSAVVQLEQALRLIVHQDDLGRVIRHEDRVGDVLEDEVEPVALTRGLHLRLPHALHLPLELVRRAAQVRHVPQHGQHGVLRSDALAERMRQHLEQQVAAFVRIHEIQLTRLAAARARAHDRRARQERREQQVVHLHGAASTRAVLLTEREQMLSPAVLRDDVVSRIGDDDGVGERVHHQRQAIALATQPIALLAPGLQRRHAGEDRASHHGDVGEVPHRQVVQCRGEHHEAARSRVEPALAQRHQPRARSGEHRLRLRVRHE